LFIYQSDWKCWGKLTHPEGGGGGGKANEEIFAACRRVSSTSPTAPLGEMRCHMIWGRSGVLFIQRGSPSRVFVFID